MGLLALAVATAAAVAAEPSLIANPWSIVEMEGKRLRTPATITFTRIRWLGMNTACGPLSGWYRQSGAKLRIHIIGDTLYSASYGSPCHGIDYQLLLGRVRTTQADGGGLLLLGKDDKPIARLIEKK
jgi:hypothetical protein